MIDRPDDNNELQLNNIKVKSNGAVVTVALDSNKNPQIYFSGFSQPVGTLYLTSTAGTSFKDSLVNTISTDDDYKAAFEAMQNYFKQTYIADTSLKKYLSTDNLNDGTSALNALSAADSQLQTALTTVGQGSTITERKISELDKLILKTLQESLDK